MNLAAVPVDELPVSRFRQPEHEIEPLLYHRWSPRAMSGESLSEEELCRLFEAARWAPSSYNGQPWRFFYARRETPHWERFFGWLDEFNQGWAHRAAVLIVIASRTTFEANGEPAPTHSFDTGAAWQNLALQGRRMGLVVHGMQGFDYERAQQELDLPYGLKVEAMAAVGHPAAPQTLPQELREKERPNERKPIRDFVFEGGHP